MLKWLQPFPNVSGDSIENVKLYPSATVPVPSGLVSNLNDVPKSVVWKLEGYLGLKVALNPRYQPDEEHVIKTETRDIK